MTFRLLVLGLPLAVSACSAGDQAETGHIVEPDSLYVDPIPISMDLRLRERFDYGTYHGVIASSESFSELWSQLVNVQREHYGRRVDVPASPDIDFANYVLLWFADRGVGASLVDSLEVRLSTGRDSVLATVHVFHSDFGSRRLNLWQMPRTARPVAFAVRHSYETGVP